MSEPTDVATEPTANPDNPLCECCGDDYARCCAVRYASMHTPGLEGGGACCIDCGGPADHRGW